MALVAISFGGLVWPLLLLLAEGTPENPSQFIDLGHLFVCHLLATTSSQSLFSTERRFSTLQAVLATPLRPANILLGNWAWLFAVSLTALVLMLVAARLCVLFTNGHLWPSWKAFYFSMGAVSFIVAYVSWVISANSFISLVLRDSKFGQVLGAFLTILPVFLVFFLSMLSQSGQQVTLTGLIVGTVVCTVLAAVTFRTAVASFQMERTRC